MDSFSRAKELQVPARNAAFSSLSEPAAGALEPLRRPALGCVLAVSYQLSAAGLKTRRSW
jgi:hypothetical protein